MQHSTQGGILPWNQRLDHSTVHAHARLLKQGFDIKPFLEVSLSDIEYPGDSKVLKHVLIGRVIFHGLNYLIKRFLWVIKDIELLLSDKLRLVAGHIHHSECGVLLAVEQSLPGSGRHLVVLEVAHPLPPHRLV